MTQDEVSTKLLDSVYYVSPNKPLTVDVKMWGHIKIVGVNVSTSKLRILVEPEYSDSMLHNGNNTNMFTTHLSKSFDKRKHKYWYISFEELTRCGYKSSGVDTNLDFKVEM